MNALEIKDLSKSFRSNFLYKKMKPRTYTNKARIFPIHENLCESVANLHQVLLNLYVDR